MSEEDIRKSVEGASVIDFAPHKEKKDATELDRDLAYMPRNDYGNGQRLIRRFGDDLMYVSGRGWFVWDGRRWEADQEAMATRKLAHKVAAAIKTEAATIDVFKLADKLLEEDEYPNGHLALTAAAKIPEAARKFAVQSGNQARAAAMINEASPYLSVPTEELDADHYLVTVQNGTIELPPPNKTKFDTVGARPHRRDDRITNIMEVAFDKNAKRKQWEAFLESILPDENVRRFIQTYYGYMLSGDGSAQCLCLFYGGGANGKSTLMDVVAEIMGDYAKVLPFASLLHDDKKRGGDATPDLARLPGARYVRASEPDAGVRFSESLIKQLTGGEPITARMLNKDFFEFLPQFKLVLAFNSRPTIRGADDGIWRRIHMVPFDVRIPKKDRDPNLKEKLLEEASGILNWLIEGYLVWREVGLQPPDVVLQATDEYRMDQDPVGVFLKFCVEEVATPPGEQPHKIQATELYSVYCMYCAQNSVAPLSSTLFGRLVAERGIRKVKSSLTYYVGIRFTEAGSALEPNGQVGG